jgi:hypothetical protein
MRPAISRTLTVWLTLAAVLAGTSQVAQAARRHHTKHHHAPHHKPARTRSGQPANGASCVPGGNPNDPQETFTALSEYPGNLAQFDAIFRCLANYPTVMPGWDVEAKGWTELAPDAGPLDIVLQKALMAGVWQGKVWYTHQDGGAIYNRMFDDRQTWHHRVAWTPTTLLDNKPAILVDATPVPGTDNIRMVQPGIYLGLTMVNGLQPIWGPNSTWTVPPGLAYGYFTLDFLNTTITKSECPICTPHSQTGP